jgi:hypothetical protein
VTFRGASVLELEDGQIRHETNYYDLPQMQQQIAAAGGTPGAVETSSAGTAATPGAATVAEQTGSVTVRIFSCPAELSQTTGQEQPDQAALLAGCAPLAAPEVAPTLRTLADDGESLLGTVTEPGVYDWEGLAFGDYAVGGGEMPADLSRLLVTDADGTPLQNVTLSLDEMASHVEYHFFYFQAGATPAS